MAELAGGPRISAAIMAHPSRLPWAEQVRDRHPELGLSIVVDTAPGRGSALATARRAWGAVAPDATHHLVLQDDCLLCRDFAVHLRAAVVARPADALSFFTEWGSRTADVVRLAALEGAAWAPAVDIYVPTLAIALPAAAARGFAESGDDQGQSDDVALARWLTAHGVGAYVSLPNLAQHGDLPSITGNGYQGPRLSVCFGAQRDFSPSGPVAPVPDWLPHISYMRAESGCFSRPRLAESDLTLRLTADFLADRFGLADQPVTAFSRAISAMAMAPVRECVGEVTLRSVWLTGYALGVLRAERASGCAGREVAGPAAGTVAGPMAGTVAGPAAGTVAGLAAGPALATLAPGGLRRFLAQPLLTRLAGPLRDFVIEAVRSGSGDYPAGTQPRDAGG